MKREKHKRVGQQSERLMWYSNMMGGYLQGSEFLEGIARLHQLAEPASRLVLLWRKAIANHWLSGKELSLGIKACARLEFQILHPQPVAQVETDGSVINRVKEEQAALFEAARQRRDAQLQKSPNPISRPSPSVARLENMVPAPVEPKKSEPSVKSEPFDSEAWLRSLSPAERAEFAPFITYHPSDPRSRV